MNEQERAAWMADRCGHITASRITDVLAKPLKGAKEATTRRNYKAELVCERMTGKTQEGYTSWDMKRGIELEPFAKAEYEIARGEIVDNCGFIAHPSILRGGASPDGLIGKHGLVQFKAPKTAHHIDYLTAGIVPNEYRPQMLWELACTGRQWCDFVSFDPHLPEHLQLFIVRFDRDEVEIAKIEDEVRRFDEEIEATIKALPTQQTLMEKLQASVEQSRAKKVENSLYIVEGDIRS